MHHQQTEGQGLRSKANGVAKDPTFKRERIKRRVGSGSSGERRKMQGGGSDLWVPETSVGKGKD